MQNEFTKPGFLSGIRDPTEAAPEDTNTRSWGQFGADTAIGLAKPLVGAARTVTQGARMGLDELPPEARPEWLGDAAHGPVADVDRSLGSAEKWLDDQRSARDKALDTDSPFPGPDQRSFWREPIASTVHQITPLIPMVAGAVLTGGTSLAAQAGVAATFGLLGVGSSLSQLRDASEQMPIDELRKLPQYQEFNGDEQAARNKVFKDSVDLKTEAATFIVNGATFGAFLQGIGSPAKKALAQRLKSMLIGGTEGAGIGAAQGAVSSYGEELGKVRRGEQESIDPAKVAESTESGTAFGLPMGLHHFVSPHRPGQKPSEEPPAPTSTPLDTDVKSVATQALQTDTPPPEPTMSPFGGDTGVPGPQQAPSAPLPPEFPNIERPGLPQPGDFPPSSSPGPPPPPAGPSPPIPGAGGGGGGAPPVGGAPMSTRSRTGVPGPARAPTEPLAPRFAEIERPGLPSPGDFGAEPEPAVPSSPVAAPRPAPAEAAVAAPARPAPVVAREEPAAGPTAARVAAREIPQGGGEGVTPGVTPEVRQEARAEPRRETTITPGAETAIAPVTQRAEHAPVTLGETLSEEAQAHMARAREQAETAQNERNAKTVAARTGRTMERTGKVKTGVERALEVALKAWKASKEKTAEGWQTLRRQAINVEAGRVAAGLRAKGYLNQIGERPVTPGGVAREVERIRTRGQPRKAPAADTNEVLTPEEVSFANRLDELHRRITPDMPQLQYRATIRPMLAEARRLDAARHENGQPAIFERALPKPPGIARSLEHQFNDHAHRLELLRHLSPDEFANSEVVRSTLQKMADINEKRVPQRAIMRPTEPEIDTVSGQLVRREQPPEPTGFRPQPHTEYRPLPTPSWVSEKLAQAHTQTAPSIIEHQPYAEAVASLAGRQYPRLPAQLPTGTAEVRRMRSEATAAGQRHDVGTVYPQGAATPGRGKERPLTSAQFEREQEAHRVKTAAGTPHGEELRREAGHAQRELTPTEARELAAAKLAEEREKGTERREHLGEIPKEEDLNTLVDQALGKKEGAAATQTTRSKHTQMREIIIEHSINSVLKKHFGAELENLRSMMDRLQIGLPPIKPAELAALEAQGVTGGRKSQAIRAGKPVAPRELVSRPKRGSALTGAALDQAVVKRIMEIAGEHVPKTLGKEQAAALKVDPARFGLRLEAEEKPRGTRESFKALREEHESALIDWQNKVFDQITAGYELKPVLEEIIATAKRITAEQRQQRGITGQSIKTWIPNGRDARTADGRIFKKYNAGHAEEKATHFNMLADIMNADEQIRLAQAAAPTVDAFDHMRAPDVQRVIGQLIPELGKLGSDWRLYEGGMAKAINEERRAKSEEVTERMKGVRPAEGGDEETRAEIPETAPSAEEQMLAAEPTFETEGDRRARENRNKREWQDMIAAQRPSTQVSGARVVGTRAKGAFEKIPKTEELPPGEGRKLSGAELEEAKQRLLANRRNRPTDGPPPETAGEYRAEVQGAREALATDDPQHPLISDHEPAAASLDRAKDIIKRGEAGDVSSFITPEFIDKLSTVNAGVRVLHAPVEVVAGERGEGQAFYQPDKDRIVLSNNVSSGDYVKNVVHEHVHAATEHLLDSDAAFRSEVEDLRQRAEAHAKQAGVTNQRLLYGLRDPHEFLSESQSNPEFRAMLGRASAPSRGVIQGAKNVINALYRSIRDAWRRVVGEKDGDTALDVLFRDTSSVLGRTDKLVAKTLDRLAMEGRQPGGTAEGRRYSPLTDKVAATASRVGKDAWSAVAQSPKFDIGMSLHSTMDLARRGVKDFQGHALKVAQVMARKATERGRIIKEQDQPKLLRTAKWLNGLNKDMRIKVEKFLTDETMHGAHADVALNDPKNKHISLFEPFNEAGPKPWALRDAQVHRMHEGMRERYNELTQVPGFVENRAALHKFFADRETEIRHEVTKALTEHLGILPASADTPRLKAAAIEVIQKHILNEKMDVGEKQRLEAIKSEAGRSNFRDVVARIRRTPELNRLAGPYIPLTRRGNWATFGRFKLGEGGDNGERPLAERDTHGRDVDEGVRMFDTREAAEAFEQRMQDKFGISQLDGGEWFIDKATGKRAREYTEEELRQLQDKTPDLNNRLLRAKEVEPGIVEEGPNRYEKKFWVKMQPKLLEFHDSRGEADASAAAWRAKHGADIEVSNAEQVHRGSGKENEKYASSQMQKLIDRVETTDTYRGLSTDQQAALKSALTLQAAKLSLRRGVRQSFKPRDYVAGVDPENLMHNFMDYSGQTAGYLANTRHYVEMAEAKASLDKFMADSRYEKDPVSTLHQRTRDELYRRSDTPAESNVNTPFDKVVDGVLKMSMFSRLAGFSYYVINSTEPVALGAPIMMDRHGPGRVAAEMAKSYRMIGPLKMAAAAGRDAYRAFRGRTEEFDANGNPTVFTDYKKVFEKSVAQQADRAGLEDFINQVQKAGLFESSASIEYQRMIKGPAVPSGTFDKAQNWASNVFQGANTAVENLNRFVTGVTAYRLERQRLGNAEDAHQKAVDYATDVMYRTNGDYRDWNSPSLLTKGPIGRLAGQYKKYPQRVLASYIEGAAASLKLLTKEGRTEENMQKAKRLVAMTVVQIGAAGVLGLPTDILKIPMNTLYLSGATSVTGDDAENWFRGKMLSQFGPMGQVITDGLSRLTPVDVASRMGLSGSIIYGSPSSRKPADVMGAAVGVMLGSGGTMARDMLKGVQLLSQSAKAKLDGADAESYKLLMQGLRYTIPVRALADLLAATEADVTTSTSGRPLRAPLTDSQSAIRALGFRPTDVTLAGEAKARVKGAADRYTAERNRLIQEWVTSPPADRRSVQKEIDDFNRVYTKGSQRITRDDQVKAIETRRKAEKAPSGEMGLPLNARTRAFLQDEPTYGRAR